MSLPNCDYKVLYDTEFEATRAAAITERTLSRTEMEPYRCGNHWHITNKDKRLRSKHKRPVIKDQCDLCNCRLVRKIGRYEQHCATRGHRMKESAYERSLTL